MDMNEKLWNCSKYEICPDPFPNQDLPGDQTVLCDSSIFCKSFNDVDSTLVYDLSSHVVIIIVHNLKNKNKF